MQILILGVFSALLAVSNWQLNRKVSDMSEETMVLRQANKHLRESCVVSSPLEGIELRDVDGILISTAAINGEISVSSTTGYRRF